MKFNKVKLMMVSSVTSMTLLLGNVSIKYAAGQEEVTEPVNTVQEEQNTEGNEEQAGNAAVDIPEKNEENKSEGEENTGAGENVNESGKDETLPDTDDTEKKDDAANGGDHTTDADQSTGGMTNPEKPGDEKNDTTTNPEKPGDEKNDTTTNPEKPGNEKNDTTTNPDISNENTGDNTTESETPNDAADNTDTPDNRPEDNNQADAGQVTVENGIVTDNSADAVYAERDYNPSERFLSMGEKIKYNENMPIENLPSFITQEMVMGALKIQDEYGYPASVTIAQIIQESGFGKYGPNGENGQGLSYLAYQYNNLFGIKGIGPAGSVNMQTGEQTVAGEYYTIHAGFRVYNTYTECMEDRAKLLKKVYSDLIEGVTDANTFAMQIGGRWATSLSYGKNLISQMERYDLYRLDRMTLKDFSELIGDFANPCPGAKLTSQFGYRIAPTAASGTFHKGLDLGTGAENIPTYAAKEGTVIIAGYSSSAGNWVVIDHGNGIVTKYMHHEAIYVKEGQHVEKGQQIGLSGTTGDSTGNHLHFQLEIDGKAVDPAPYLAKDTDKNL